MDDFVIPQLPDPSADPIAYNEAIRSHIREMVERQAKLIEERYGYSRESTAVAIQHRPPNMEVVARARQELAEFQEMTARAFARYLVPESPSSYRRSPESRDCVDHLLASPVAIHAEHDHEPD